MNNTELEAARRLFGLSQAEAAEHIGGVSQRSWSFWEREGTPIPQDVKAKIAEMIAVRRQRLQAARELMMMRPKPAELVLVYYKNQADYYGDLIGWKIHQSLAQTLAVDYGAKLVPFDNKRYCAWLSGQGVTDSEQKRSEWADHEAARCGTQDR